jgi:hypothetical protein
MNRNTWDRSCTQVFPGVASSDLVVGAIFFEFLRFLSRAQHVVPAGRVV